MKRFDSELAYKVLMDMPVFGISTRECTHELDFGDDETRLKCVKRKGSSIANCEPNNTYGLFLGLHEGVYVIGVSNLGNHANLNATETFETEEEMKQHWILD
jgi:hypothetical protein